jgi:hypothetical protein
MSANHIHCYGTQPCFFSAVHGEDEIVILLLNNQRQHRTLHNQKNMLPEAFF